MSITTAAFVNASSTTGAAAAPRGAPYVTPFVSSLPGQSFQETVTTLSAEPVEVAVARIPDADVARAPAFEPRVDDTRIPEYPVIFKAAFDCDRHVSNGCEHTIVIPPQSAGLYEIFLTSTERSALQRFIVGTLGAIADFETTDSTILPIDTRDMRRRSDVSLTGYTNTRAQIFRPGPDGLIHLPNEFYGTNLRNWPLGKLILRSSDGSILPMSYLIATPPDSRDYFDTDRSVYRSGDRVYYEYLARRPAPNEEALLSFLGPGANIAEKVSTGGPITTGALTLSRDLASGVYRFSLGGALGSISVVDPDTSKYEIDVRAATPRVAVGQAVTFAVSVHALGGHPAASVRVPYAWHFLPYIQGPIPIAQALRMEQHLMRAQTVTDTHGNATITVTSPRDRATPVELIAYEPGTEVPVATALAETVARIPQASASVSVSPETITTERRSVSIVARGPAEGDAIVRYGSPPEFRWRVVSFARHVALFPVSIGPNEDRVPVSIMTATDSQRVPPAQLVVAAAGEPHRLRVSVGCYAREYANGQPLHVCIHIRDWQHRPARSIVTVTVTEATNADVAAAEADAPYERLYRPPAETGVLYSSVTTWKSSPPISYLYPETPWSPHAGAFVFNFGNGQALAARGDESSLQSQTPYRLDQVATDKNGGLTLQLPWPIAARATTYAIRITAVAARGEVGQACAFVVYHR